MKHEGVTSRGVLLLLAGAVAIAFAPIFAKLAVVWDQEASTLGAGVSPTAVAFWRLGLALPLVILWAMWDRRRWLAARGSGSAAEAKAEPSTGSPGAADRSAAASGVPSLKWWAWCLPGFCFALDLTLWHWSFEYTTVANATLEANFAAVLLGLYGVAVLGQRYSWQMYAGGGIAFLGVVFLVGFNFSTTADAWFGDLLGMLTACCYAGYLLSVKRLAAAVPVSWVLTGTCCGGALLCGVFILVAGQNFWPQSVAAWGALAALAVVAQVVGQGLVAAGLAVTPAAPAGLILLAQPLVVVILGWLLLGQTLSRHQLAAGAAVIVGIALVKRARLQSQPED